MNDHDKAHSLILKAMQDRMDIISDRISNVADQVFDKSNVYTVVETDLVDNSDKLIGIYGTKAIADTVLKALNASSSATDSYSYKVVDSVLE